MDQFLNVLDAVGVGDSSNAPYVIAFSLIDIAIKSFLLLTVTWVAAFLLRKRSAATVHRLWTLGFFGCLLLPMISLVAPTWNLPILPTPAPTFTTQNDQAAEPQPGSFGVEQPSSTASHDVPATARATGLAKLPGASGRGQTAAMPIDGGAAKVVQSESDLAAGLSPPLTGVSDQADSSSTRSWALACFTCWIGGVFVCLLRTVWHQRSLARILGRCKSMDSAGWTSAAVDVSRSLGLNRTTRLLKLEDALSPMIAGILRPVVVLPGNADDWLPAQRSSVLLHELAHAKRYDVLTQTVAGFVCALHWFNPLCWQGLSQMRKLRELACDDLVVASGQQPADYADVLLDVARTYRHRHPLMAVGMAREANVENRISAILDRARSHVSVSRQAARVFLAAAAASDGGTSAKEESEDAVPDDDYRTLGVRITDEDGLPLEGTRLHVGVWYIKGFQGEKVPKEYVANSDGVVNLKLPRRLRILRLWPSKPRYVTEFVNFGLGKHDEGKGIPDRYDFQLERGTELSGTVVDESGQSVSDVKVDVRVEVREPAWTANPKPMISTSLTDEDWGEGLAITNKNGKWRIGNAPAQAGSKDFEFRLKFSHPDYVSDSEWGGLQQLQNLTTEMLRNGNAKLKLSRGSPLTGTVVDPAGNPVTQGLVIWHDDPDGDAKKYEMKLDELGHFQTGPLPPGEHPITVVAPGFQPERRMVSVTNTTADIQIKLKPGKRLTVRVVSVDGKPIPGAYIHVGSWLRVEPPFNGVWSGIFKSRIPNHANDEGVFVWDGAPDDAVTYSIEARGFCTTTVTLIATEAEHVVELKRSLLVSGKVTDARTGEPLHAFRVIPILDRRPTYRYAWYLGAVTGEQGQFEIRLDDISSSRSIYRLRLEADGYRSAVSAQTFELNDGHVTQDFSLEPAPARRGFVVNEARGSVASALVVQATPSIVPTMKDAVLAGGWSARQIETTGDGQFQLAATFEPVRIRVTHEIGFAEVLRQPDEVIGTIQLQPWSRVSGRLLQDGNPIADQSVYFNPVPRGQRGEPRFQDSYQTKTDADGRFEFERLPPIAGAVRVSLGPWRDSPLTSSQAVPLVLKPGEHMKVELGGNGISVTGKIVATGRGDAKLNKQWSLNYLIDRDRGIESPAGFPELSFDPAGPVQASWFLEPKHYDWLATRENYFVKLQPDGELRISGVPPGTYDLVLRLYEQPAGCLVETIGEKVVTVVVTKSDSTLGTKDIGTIEVACRAGPRVGENMQVYAFTDPSGRQRTIQEMKGRYVLMHVWASWCAPCLEKMPEMQASVDRLSDQPITFIGLNVDKDASQARALAERGGWNWSQNYLGDASDVARQLAISSVPSYYLVGPDGLLVASSTDWPEIRDKLGDSLHDGSQ